MATNLRVIFGSSMPLPAGTAASTNTFVINGTTDAIEWVFQADEDATITRLGFNISATGGTPPDLRVSIQTVTTSTGRASGTLLGATNAAKADFTAATGWSWKTLGESATVTRGGYYAVRVDYTSGATAPSGTNTATFQHGLLLPSSYSLGFPYVTTVDAGSGTKQTTNYPIFGYGSASVAYGAPMSTYTTETIDSGTTPDEVGMAFTLPASWASTYRVAGARLLFLTPVTARTVIMSLYLGTTALQTMTIYSDVLQAVSSTRPCEMLFDESALSTIVAGQQYRVALAPSDTSADISPRFVTVSNNADLAAWSGGVNYYYTSRKNAEAWSDTTTKRLIMELILEPITGLLGLTGGMQA